MCKSIYCKNLTANHFNTYSAALHPYMKVQRGHTKFTIITRTTTYHIYSRGMNPCDRCVCVGGFCWYYWNFYIYTCYTQLISYYTPYILYVYMYPISMYIFNNKLMNIHTLIYMGTLRRPLYQFKS